MCADFSLIRKEDKPEPRMDANPEGGLTRRVQRTIETRTEKEGLTGSVAYTRLTNVAEVKTKRTEDGLSIRFVVSTAGSAAHAGLNGEDEQAYQDFQSKGAGPASLARAGGNRGSYQPVCWQSKRSFLRSAPSYFPSTNS